MKGNIYANGSWALMGTSDYNWLYHYSGSISLNYAINKIENTSDPVHILMRTTSSSAGFSIRVIKPHLKVISPPMLILKATNTVITTLQALPIILPTLLSLLSLIQQLLAMNLIFLWMGGIARILKPIL